MSNQRIADEEIGCAASQDPLGLDDLSGGAWAPALSISSNIDISYTFLWCACRQGQVIGVSA
jgi:hypothetical protein